VDLFKQVYGRLFFQISIYSRRSARADFLARNFAHTSNSSDIDSYRSFAEDLLQRDALELQEKYGQDVTRIFHDADLIVNTDISNPSPADQIIRFCELLFGANSISPTKPEYGMLAARMAALRSLDLSRQVGAAIFTGSGEIIALGSNEVPKAGGGTYWCDDPFDDREFRRSADSNDQRKREIFGEVLDVLSPGADLNAAMANEAVRNLQLMDALEYGRIVHAEMSALMDAARLGRSVRGGTLFCTTFPCHMCAKHIVAAGLAKVVFLEPYPKSLAFDLHSDSLEIEGTDRGKYSRYPSVVFEHFSGITPRRYRDMFPRGKRKEGGMFARYGKSTKAPPQPTIDIRIPVYAHLESAVLQNLFKSIESVSKRQVPPLFQTF
jgi:deoxycytidylate deaminase